MDPTAADKNDISKQIRQTEKGELSGDAYSCAEQEVQGAWTRDAKRIYAGQPIPSWKPTSALSVTGKQKKADSGIKLELEQDQYILYIRAQSKESPGGSWLRLPVAKNTRRDEYQSEVLDKMVCWEIPIKKATIHIERHGIIVRLTYPVELPPLRPFGSRVATLGPVIYGMSGELRSFQLRTELKEHAKDYRSKLILIQQRKDTWDLVRRRALCQIGRRKGHARLKREMLSRMSWDDWLHTYLHTWSREVVEWCHSQGIGMIHVVEIGNGDWPADQFVHLLTYKAAEAGIEVKDGSTLDEVSTQRTVKAELGRQQKDVKKRQEAVRELINQFEGLVNLRQK